MLFRSSDMNTICENSFGSNISVFPQSTTRNITGIFDLSGGASERVMGNYNKTTSGSGFSENLNDLEEKYYDNFTTTDSTTACGGECLGYAYSETNQWFGEYHDFPFSTIPWVIKGGLYLFGEESGLMAATSDYGRASKNCTFRITIT